MIFDEGGWFFLKLAYRWSVSRIKIKQLRSLFVRLPSYNNAVQQVESMT